MPNFKEYLEMDGNIAFNLAIYNRFSSIGDGVYAEICGGFIEGVYQWATHHIMSVEECQNEKYTGWTVRFEHTERRVYIPNWVLNITPSSWKHAKNLFNKYLQEDIKFNQTQY
jgi:hypothetical protein